MGGNSGDSLIFLLGASDGLERFRFFFAALLYAPLAFCLGFLGGMGGARLS